MVDRPHDGTIVTGEPNVMWSTDAIDHFTAECVGIHAPPSTAIGSKAITGAQGLGEHSTTLGLTIDGGLDVTITRTSISARI